MEYAVMQNYSKGDDTGHLVPVFKSSTTQDVVTGRLKLFRLDYCFGPAISTNITITVVAEDQKVRLRQLRLQEDVQRRKSAMCDPHTLTYLVGQLTSYWLVWRVQWIMGRLQVLVAW
ncbi:hypothetical protein OS493_005972 [Desmophyllum pertusum]|uniref:Uncharacterized protein n=1 Tax=Desmophyllum pertusum TaxID=174260 RepID=A0A9W9YFV4_9CNID|nr:hypothetical protein OS493_005972 [Desmophyllum pertusum]